MAKNTTDQILDDLADSVGVGFDKTMEFANKALDDKTTAKDLVKEGVDLAYDNSTRMVDFYKSTYNLLFRRKK